MPPTYALYIDDDASDQGSYIGNLQEALDRAYPYADFKLEAVDFADGRARLENEGDRYKVAFIDVLQKREDGVVERDGLSLMELAMDRRVAVVAISARPSEVGIDVERIGVRATAVKGQLAADHRREQLQRKIKLALRDASIAIQPANEVKLEGTDDVRVAAIVHQVREENLVPLIFDVCDATPEQIGLRYVRPGLSGAVVLHVEYVADGARHELLLKLTRDEEQARDEFAAYRTVRSFTQLMSPPHLVDRIHDEGGWHALAMGFKYGSSLTDWLITNPDEGRVGRTLGQLFLADGLSDVYASSDPSREDEPPTRCLHETVLKVGRHARIRLALEELEPLLHRRVEAGQLDPASGRRADEIRTFLVSSRIGELDEEKLPGRARRVLSHGDLHGRNVLVDVHDRAVLLDPTDIAPQHWAADWARMTVDLLLSGLAVDPRAHEWDLLPWWRTTADAVVRDRALPSGNEPPDGDPLPAGVRSALGWLRAQVPQIFSAIDGLPVEWELRLALAIELMRGTYRRESLPTQVRVLALLAAGDALQAAAEAVPQDDAR